MFQELGVHRDFDRFLGHLKRSVFAHDRRTLKKTLPGVRSGDPGVSVILEPAAAVFGYEGLQLCARQSHTNYKRRLISFKLLSLLYAIEFEASRALAWQHEGKSPLGKPRSRYFLYLFIYCNWVVTRWQWLFYM